jgi:hypothetical protein
VFFIALRGSITSVDKVPCVAALLYFLNLVIALRSVLITYANSNPCHLRTVYKCTVLSSIAI